MRYTVRVAGVGAGEEALREQILFALGIDDAAGKSHAGIEVADVAILVVSSRGAARSEGRRRE